MGRYDLTYNFEYLSQELTFSVNFLSRCPIEEGEQMKEELRNSIFLKMNFEERTEIIIKMIVIIAIIIEIAIIIASTIIEKKAVEAATVVDS